MFTAYTAFFYFQKAKENYERKKTNTDTEGDNEIFNKADGDAKGMFVTKTLLCILVC